MIKQKNDYVFPEEEIKRIFGLLSQYMPEEDFLKLCTSPSPVDREVFKSLYELGFSTAFKSAQQGSDKDSSISPLSDWDDVEEKLLAGEFEYLKQSLLKYKANPAGGVYGGHIRRTFYQALKKYGKEPRFMEILELLLERGMHLPSYTQQRLLTIPEGVEFLKKFAKDYPYQVCSAVKRAFASEN